MMFVNCTQTVSFIASEVLDSEKAGLAIPKPLRGKKPNQIIFLLIFAGFTFQLKPDSRMSL